MKSTPEIKFLEWDSNFFNIKVGELVLEGFNDLTTEGRFDVVYVKSKLENQVVLKGYSNLFKQVKVTFVKKIQTPHKIEDLNICSVILSPNIKKDLYSLAFESGKYSRFLLDEKFGKNSFKKMYKKWIDNSFDNDFATDIIVYKELSETLGFITYKVFGNYAVIGLVAVDSKSQGKGVGSKLVKFVENSLLMNSITELRIPTQLENELACKFYNKLDYKILEKEYIKHFWNNDTI